MHDVERSADWLMFCRHRLARSTYKCLENRPLFLSSRLKFDGGFRQWDNGFQNLLIWLPIYQLLIANQVFPSSDGLLFALPVQNPNCWYGRHQSGNWIKNELGSRDKILWFYYWWLGQRESVSLHLAGCESGFHRPILSLFAERLHRHFVRTPPNASVHQFY